MNVQEKIISVVLLEKIKNNPRSAKELGLQIYKEEILNNQAHQSRVSISNSELSKKRIK